MGTSLSLTERIAAALMHLLGVLTLFVGPTIVYLLARSTFLKQSALNAVYWHGFMFMIGLLVFTMWTLSSFAGLYQSMVMWWFIFMVGWLVPIVFFGVYSAFMALFGSQGQYLINRNLFRI